MITFKEKSKLLFADLDGTLIETKSGNTFARGAWDWKMKDGVLEALKNFGAHIHIISNQGGIEKGLVKEEEWLRKIACIIEKIQTETGLSVSYDYCKSLDPEEPKRKPNPGMITDYLEKHPEYTDTLMIGDASGLIGNFSNSDFETAKNANVLYMDINTFIEKYQ